MANKPKDYSGLPDWPRLMMADLACRYVSYSRNGFVRRVGEIWPQPIRLGGKALDEAVDQLLGGTEPLVDPFTAAIKCETIKRSEVRGRSVHGSNQGRRCRSSEPKEQAAQMIPHRDIYIFRTA